MKKPHAITTVLHQNKSIHNLSLHAQRLNQINLVLQQVLPADFVSRCTLSNIRSDTLILHTDNASIANLLRFQAATLCQQVSQQCKLNVTSLKINVRPTQATTPSQQKKAPSRHAIPLSKNNAALLRATAETINDPALKNALTKLAQRVKQ